MTKQVYQIIGDDEDAHLARVIGELVMAGYTVTRERATVTEIIEIPPPRDVTPTTRPVEVKTKTEGRGTFKHYKKVQSVNGMHAIDVFREVVGQRPRLKRETVRNRFLRVRDETTRATFKPGTFDALLVKLRATKCYEIEGDDVMVFDHRRLAAVTNESLQNARAKKKAA